MKKYKKVFLHPIQISLWKRFPLIAPPDDDDDDDTDSKKELHKAKGMRN